MSSQARSRRNRTASSNVNGYTERVTVEAAARRERGVFDRGPFPPPGDMPTTFAFKYRYLATKQIPKSGGRVRTLIVPRGKLRDAQDLALDYLQHCYNGRYGISLLECHTAFKRGCNAYDNAERHREKKISVKFDIKNFFDSIPGLPRKAAKIAAFFNVRRAERRKLAIKKKSKVKTDPARSKYTASVLCVFECLVREGIPQDIARWITDIATVNGYLYQGSPLSPLLANLVTKHGLAKKMLKLATVYDLPIFHMFQQWYMVFDYSGKKVWYYNTGADIPKFQQELKVVRSLVESKLGIRHRNAPIVVDSMETSWEEMSPEDNEDLDAMLLRYGQSCWTPRMTGTVGKIRRALVRKVVYPGGKGTDKFRLEYRDMRHYALGKTVFTLYADDGVLSSNNKKLFMVRHVIKRIVEDSGFFVNSSKGIRVMRKSRHITGYQVCPAPGAKDQGTRIDYATRRAEYRAYLNHMKTGKRPLNEETIRQFEGKLSYLRMSNPNWWRIYAAEFRDLISQLDHCDPAAELVSGIVERYKDL